MSMLESSKMRNLLGICAVAAASILSRGSSTSIAIPSHGGLTGPHSTQSEYDNNAWTKGPSRPSNILPSGWHPSFKPSRPSNTVSDQPPSPITVILPGYVSISTSIITWIQVITRNVTAPTTTITIEKTTPSATTVYLQHTTTESPSSACYSSNTSVTSNPAVCNGKGCEITFEKGAIVHWEPLSSRTPLVTHYLRSTCVAVVCNTTEFSLYYSRSATSCDRPPCPSNSLNCECNIVVGPFTLPDGRINSITQTGSSGWNLNLGPAATAQNVGHCGTNGPVCEASATTLFTPLVYTDDVKVLSTAAYRNDTRAEATAFLLPQLTDYFPAGDPLGMCTNIKLSIPPTTATPEKRDDVATVGGDGVTTWPGCETLTDDSNAKRGLVARQTLSSDTTQLPICSSEERVSTKTVTVTPQGTSPSIPVETQARSAASGSQSQSQWAWYIWLALVLQWLKRGS